MRSARATTCLVRIICSHAMRVSPELLSEGRLLVGRASLGRVRGSIVRKNAEHAIASRRLQVRRFSGSSGIRFRRDWRPLGTNRRRGLFLREHAHRRQRRHPQDSHPHQLQFGSPPPVFPADASPRKSLQRFVRPARHKQTPQNAARLPCRMVWDRPDPVTRSASRAPRMRQPATVEPYPEASTGLANQAYSVMRRAGYRWPVVGGRRGFAPVGSTRLIASLSAVGEKGLETTVLPGSMGSSEKPVIKMIATCRE